MIERAFLKNAGRMAIVFALAGVFFSVTARAQNAGKQFVPNSMPAEVSKLSPISRLAAGTQMNLAIGLPLRNENALDDLIGQIYDPASPNYRHYLTRDQFISQFGPTETDYQTVENFFRANGFAVTEEHPNRLVLDISGTAADVERVFHVTLQTYHHPNERRDFFAPNTTPSLDLSVPIVHVSGLDNYSLPHPRIVKKMLLDKNVKAMGLPGSGPGGTYMGKDFRAAYAPGVSLTGTGQIVGLLEFDTYHSNDVAAYITTAGIPGVLLTNVSVSGGVKNPGGDNGEVALDIEVAMAMAPGLTRIVVYQAPATASFDSIISVMANDNSNSPAQFSCSWGNVTPGARDTTAEGLFKQMKAQGQSFFNASQDTNAFINGVPFPAESTNIMQVGGTTLTTAGPNGARVLETVWNWGGNAPQFGSSGSIGSSGGISLNYGIPPWQQGISMTANGGSPSQHNTPDVAMTADNIFVIADTNQQEVIGGTSAAAPLWAGFTALANQQAVANGKPTAGFINPAIYAVAKTASYPSIFADVVTGNNFWSNSPTAFPAVPGYDLCTGWGTPLGDNMIDLLSGASDALAVAPGRGFVAVGPQNGPFTFTNMTFLLTNSGAASLNWSLVNTSSWLTASASGGTLSPGGPATNIIVSVNTTGFNLPPGTYSASLLFTNQTSHATRMRQFVLLAGQQLLQNGDFEDTPFSLSYWVQSGAPAGFNNIFVDDGTDSSLSPESGSYLAAFGKTSGNGYLSQTIPTVPGQNYFLSFWFEDTQSASTAQFVVNWNTNTATTNTLLSLQNPATFSWSNYTYYVTATSTNTVLQFGGQRNTGYFGLDNVSLVNIPTPNPGLSQISRTAVALKWPALTNLVYNVQYSTDLTSPNWFNLTTNTAKGPTLGITNSTATNSLLFYRVKTP